MIAAPTVPSKPLGDAARRQLLAEIERALQFDENPDRRASMRREYLALTERREVSQ